MSGDFLSPPLATHQALSGIAPLSPKLLTAHGCLWSIPLVLERVPPLALSLLSHGFPGSHATKHSRLLHFKGFRPALIAHQKLPLFPYPGSPGASFASCAVSTLVANCHYLEVFLIAALNSLKHVLTWYSHGSLITLLGSNSDQIWWRWSRNCGFHLRQERNDYWVKNPRNNYYH